MPPAFLLQQAAWLYERHLDHVRAQLKKVGGGASAPLSLDSTHTVMGGVPMKRIGSAGSTSKSGVIVPWVDSFRLIDQTVDSRPPSLYATRPKDNPTPTGDFVATAGMSEIPNITSRLLKIAAPTLSRTPSTNTITQSRAANQQPSGRQQVPLYRQKLEQERIERGKSATNVIEKPRTPSPAASPSTRSLSSSSSSDSESESDNPVTRSQLFKRPPRFRSQRTRDLSTYDEDIEEADEADPGTGTMLPFANSAGRTKGIGSARDALPTTPRTDKSARRSRDTGAADFGFKQDIPSGTEASSSMASSASDAPRPDLASPGPLSPRHRASLVKSSPMRPGNKSGKEGSEGTPSMGSSFSDIDGTWVWVD